MMMTTGLLLQESGILDPCYGLEAITIGIHKCPLPR